MACTLLAAATPASAQDTTRLPHPRLVTPDVPWVLTVPGEEMLLYVHSGFHPAGRVKVSLDGMRADQEIMSVMSSARHVVHPFEVHTVYGRIIIEAKVPAYVALVERDRFATSGASALSFSCDGRSGAVLWTPPPSAHIMFRGDDGAPTVTAYARPAHWQLWADGDVVEREGQRLTTDEAYWVVHEGSGAGCAGVMRLQTVAAPVIVRNPFAPGLAALVLGAGAAVWLAPRLPEPALPRRRRTM